MRLAVLLLLITPAVYTLIQGNFVTSAKLLAVSTIYGFALNWMYSFETRVSSTSILRNMKIFGFISSIILAITLWMMIGLDNPLLIFFLLIGCIVLTGVVFILLGFLLMLLLESIEFFIDPEQKIEEIESRFPND